EGDGFREPGYAKNRRVEPLTTVGLLTDREGFPLQVRAFEGDRAEVKTVLPVVREFMAAHKLEVVAVVADAGMISEENKLGLDKEGLSFVIGGKLPEVLYQIAQWRKTAPEGPPPDGLTLVQPQPAGGEGKLRGARDRKIVYRYDAKRAARTFKGIDGQVREAEDAVAGRGPVKRNRFVRLDNAGKSVDRQLEAKARELAGWKAYETDLAEDADFIVKACHGLWHVENSFRMSENDLMACPVCRHKRESIDAHIAIVFAALAVSRRIEAAAGWTVRRIVRTPGPHRTATVRVAGHTMDIEPDLPDDLQAVIDLTR
ncbi:MAG: transposase, partial [Propionibacteriaceae bacterium]|nr:transposase [Propionibacteriaceae bacterium]